MEFNALSVPLIALLDSNTVGIEDVYFPLVSSAPSQRWAFYFLRAAVKVGKAGFGLKKYLLYPFYRYPLPLKLDKPVISRSFYKTWKLEAAVFRRNLAKYSKGVLRRLNLQIFRMLKKQRKLGIRRQVRVFKSSFFGVYKTFTKSFFAT